MQSPSLDDQDDSRVRSEFDSVLQQQQSNRDSSIQNSIEHEPFDLPVDNHQATATTPSHSHPTSRDTGASYNRVDDSYLDSTLSPSVMSTSHNDPTPSDVVSPTSLLNHWSDLNHDNSNTSSSPLTTVQQIDNLTEHAHSQGDQQLSHEQHDQQQEQEEEQHQKQGQELVGPDESTCFTVDANGDGDSTHHLDTSSVLQPSHTHLPNKPSIRRNSNEDSLSKQTQPSPNIQHVKNISPIKRGHTVAALFPAVSSEQRNSTHRPVSAGRPVSSHTNENKDSANTNTSTSTSNTSQTSTTRKNIAKTSGTANSTTSQQNASPNVRGGGGKSTADMYNKLKAEWGGGAPHGRRKSMVSGNTSFSSTAGGGGGGSSKEPPFNHQQQMSAITGIRQRSTLVVSKAMGGGIYGASIRQPSSGDSDTDSQALSSPKKNRLYDDAMTQSKRREIIRQKSLRDEENHRQDQAYRVPKASRRLNNKVTRKNDHLPVSDRLYNEAAAISKKKEEKSKSWATKKATALTDWSCLQCGTYNAVKVLLVESSCDSATVLFTCSSCKSTFDGFTLEESMFRPTNVAIMNGSMDDRAVNTRRTDGNHGESIHEYLYANTYLETKKLQLLKETWEDEDEVLTFKPIIPQSSKELLRRYQKTQKENYANGRPNNGAVNLGSSGNSGASKIIVSEMGLQSYLTLPLTERLSKAETLCRVVKSDQKDSRHTTKHHARNSGDDKKGVEGETNRSKSKPLSATKMDDLFTRLTYEYIEKATKVDLTRKAMDKADASGKEYFHPTIGVVPSSVYSSTPVFSSEKKETIYEKLLRKGAEAKERAKLLKAKVLKKEKYDIEKNYSQPLSKSKTILKESSDQCVEEIFKLLIANQLFFQKNAIPSTENNDKNGVGVQSNERIKLTAEYLSDVSEKLEKFDNLTLDIRTIDPNLVVEEVQALLSDLRTLGLKNASLQLQKLEDDQRGQEKGQEEEQEQKEATPAASDIYYFVSFEQFQGMIKQCTAKRAGGVGRSYIYTPKVRDTTVKEMLAEESKEYTYCPTITEKSKQLAKNRGRGDVAIDVILNDEAYMRDQRMQHMKTLIEYDQNKECTFKPTLYAPPKSVIPTYRGQPRAVAPGDMEVCIPQGGSGGGSEEEEEDDDVSLITTSTCSTTIRPFSSTPKNNDDAAGDLVLSTHVPVMRLKQDKEDRQPLPSRSLSNLFPASTAAENSQEKDVTGSQGAGVIDISEHILEAEEEKKSNLSVEDVALRWARNNSKTE